MRGPTRQEKRQIRQELEQLARRFDHGGPLDDAWALEQVALTALPVVLHPDTPPELAELTVDAFATRGDEVAAGVLKALERLAHPPLREYARAAGRELAERGVRSPHEEDIGSLRVTGAAILRFDGEDGAIVCLLQRPASPQTAQAVVAFIQPGRGALVEVQAGDPEPAAEARRRFKLSPSGAKRREATPQEALDLLTRAIEVGEPLLDEMMFDLAILERALTGEEMALPRPPIYPDEDVEAEESDGFAGRLVERMIEEGVDPADPAQLSAWMEDYNARPYEERRAITGELPQPGRPQPKRKKQQRRQAKASRKRNRRR